MTLLTLVLNPCSVVQKEILVHGAVVPLCKMDAAIDEGEG